MTNLPKMSKKAAAALEILSNGGRYVNRLETNSYTGRTQFRRCLVTGRSGYATPVKGFGVSTFYELQELGLIQSVTAEWSSVCEYYKLAVAA